MNDAERVRVLETVVRPFASQNPISIRGSDLPGFPVQDELATYGINLSDIAL